MTKHSNKSNTAVASDWLSEGGEMGKLIRAKDWSATPLGPLDRWPQSLRTTVSICLASNFPINIIWGPGRVQIYNDGYWPICGDKHPHSMGQDYKECWFSAWDAIGEAFENASHGKTDFIVNSRMFLDRNGYLEETFFTFSLSPIRDESGGVGGCFHPVTEMTQTTLAERRLKVVRDLADRTAEAHSVATACELIIETLAHHALDVPFALLYLLDGKTFRLTASTGAQFPDQTWPLEQAAHTRQVIEIESIPPLALGPYPEPPHTALMLPINVSGLEQPFGVFIAGVSSRRALDEAYRIFYMMLRESATNALTNARSYEEERKRAEALAELDRAKTAFFSNVSHEFRTPLTLMLGPLEDALAFEGDVPAQLREEITIAHRNALRLLKLVNTLLDFSRIESGRIEASYEPVVLASITAELASNFRSAVERAGMRLVIDCPDLAEEAWIDQDMWEKIVLNLLSNAFKFTFEGEIRVHMAKANQHFELTVSDTGTGIAESELPQIFERFHRVRGAQARSHEGSGIGLALVQELVKLHGGSLTVTSTLGQGTTFTIRIPTGKEHLPQDRIAAPRKRASTAISARSFVEEALRWLPDESTGNLTPAERINKPTAVELGAEGHILLVDDNADMRHYVKRLLVGHYDVETAADGASALHAARERTPDLVLADIMMPGMDGLELLRALRAEPRTRETPVILLSARAGDESKAEGLGAGADDYLVKPFTARELLARVKAHVKLAQERRATRLELSLRLADLEKANTEIRDGRRAALNVLEDAVEARNRAERLYRNLCASEERFRRFVTAISDVVYTMSADWSEMRHLAGKGFIATTEVPSRTWLQDYIPKDEQPRLQQAIQEAIRTGNNFELEHQIIRLDGTIGWILSRAVPVIDADGNIIEWLGAASDVTARKLAEDGREL